MRNESPHLFDAVDFAPPPPPLPSEKAKLLPARAEQGRTNRDGREVAIIPALAGGTEATTANCVVFFTVYEYD
jgi:hypothetical protein